jgi:hypothetical protein
VTNPPHPWDNDSFSHGWPTVRIVIVAGANHDDQSAFHLGTLGQDLERANEQSHVPHIWTSGRRPNA